MAALHETLATLDVSDERPGSCLLAKLGHDELMLIWPALSPDDHLAAALTCQAFNRLRPRQRKFPWIAGEMGGQNPMVTVHMKTRLLSVMRSPALQAWAVAIEAPSIFPHWVEIFGLSGAPQYNGRVGRALGPPNANGRQPVEVDAGFGELPRRGVRSTPGLKALLVKPANVHILTSLESELVYACYATGGGGLGSGWESVVLPRQHSCFSREEHASEMVEGRGNRAGLPIDDLNAVLPRMDGKTQAQMSDPMQVNWMMGFMTNRAAIRPPTYKHAASKTHVPGSPPTPESSFPLDHALWARVQRSPLLHKCGVRLALQRVERPHARDRTSMQNQLATFLMLDTDTGFAPPHWQDGIGDVYIYRAPGVDEGMGGAELHLDMDEVGFMWEYVSGELASGEYVRRASAARYQAGLERYRSQHGDDGELLAEGVAGDDVDEDDD